MENRKLDIAEAAQALLDGEVIAFPTETFYGLGCDALNPDAVGRVYLAKRRQYGLPLPVIIGSRGMLPQIATGIPPLMYRLMDAFWPGPLSLVLRAAKEVPDLLTAGTGRIAVRLSPHPACIALCQASGKVLTSSSANVSGNPPVTRAADLDPTMMQDVRGVYDYGPCPGGGEPSSIVDILEDGGEGVLRLLREGAISAAMLQAKGFKVVSSAG